MKLVRIILTLGLFSFSASAICAEQTPRVNDYPTQARVEYVLGCMMRYGGENYNNLYHCVCAVDKIAEAIPYDNYVASTTLAVMINTPGEKGGPFRDATGGRKAVRAFQGFLDETEAACGLKKVEPKPAPKTQTETKTEPKSDATQ